MMKRMAQLYGGYSQEELDNKDYLAMEMYLIDAMQRKIVIEPKIVSFNFTLRETDEYKYVVYELPISVTSTISFPPFKSTKLPLSVFMAVYFSSLLLPTMVFS